MNVVKEPAAGKELIDAAAFYERRRPGLGDRFIDEVERVIALLLEHPELGAGVGQDFRFVVLDRFPFRLVYAVEQSVIRIIAIAHQKRRPDYWHGRVEEPRPAYALRMGIMGVEPQFSNDNLGSETNHPPVCTRFVSARASAAMVESPHGPKSRRTL
jgi:toxin ParE1/3/4